LHHAHPVILDLTCESKANWIVSGFYVERSFQATDRYTRVSAGLLPPASTYRFTDSNVTPGVTYFYRLEAIDRTGGREFFGPISARIEGGSIRPALGPQSSFGWIKHDSLRHVTARACEYSRARPGGEGSAFVAE